MRFWLGTHKPHWLADSPVPLFVSAVRLRGRKSFPRAGCDWALDSGGFSEIATHGRWTFGPRAYVAMARRFRDEIGRMAWNAPQDWMCEPQMIEKTGLSVARHQELTLFSYLDLKALAPDLNTIPVLQGYRLAEYLRHADLYQRYGIDLARLPLVGLGSVCRRQGMDEATAIVRALAVERGIRLHGFGFKVGGLVSERNGVAPLLASADSLAWSYQGRSRWRFLRERLCGGQHTGGCANCRTWALAWERRLGERIAARCRRHQPTFC